MVQLIPLYVWSRSITGSISLGALFFFQMVRDAQDPKRRWLSIGTERSGALSHVVQPICFKFDHRFLAAKKGSKALVPGTSCRDILDSGDAQGDGEYWIDPTASGDPFRVYCDMVTDGGKFKSLPSFQTGWLAFKEQGTRLTYNGAAWHKECEMSHFLASSPKAYIRHQLNIHVMVNWQLSEKIIRWPKSHDSIACSDVKFRVFSKRISPKATSGYNFRT